MKSPSKKSSWKLSDIIDFESLITDPLAWRDSWRGRVRKELNATPNLSELEKRRTGFRWMLHDVRSTQAESQGNKLNIVSSMLTVSICIIMLLAGIGLIRSLITPFSFYEYNGSATSKVELRGFNVWILLAVTLGVQWLFIIINVLGYFLWRKWAGSFNFLQNIISVVIKKWSGVQTPRVTSGDYKHVWKWRLTRIIQAGGIAYNTGLIIGLFGCLWFLKVGFYWETSLQFGESSLKALTSFLSFPTGQHLPSTETINYTNLAATARENLIAGSISPRDSAFLNWSLFFFIALAIWGLLPRLIFWVSSIILEHRACAHLHFQESHHRTLWRDITKVQRGEIVSTPSDGAVLLDIGGLEITTEELRPFLLQELRINPENRFSLGTLDERAEEQALTASKTSAMGIVFIVEGWNLSPKQMTIYHQKVREVIGHGHMIRYVVISSEAEGTEIQQWTTFIDGMKDAETEIYPFTQPKTP